jgi:superfamily I DNA and RNA helicase
MVRLTTSVVKRFYGGSGGKFRAACKLAMESEKHLLI